VILTSENISQIGTLTDKVKSVLNEIIKSSDLIKFVALTTMDGFTISSVSKDGIDVDPKWLGALIVASIRNLENNLRKALSDTTLTELVISLDQDILVIRTMGKLSLIMIADKTLDIDFVMYEIEEGLRELSALLLM
jgi:predicted regulator of Ras-like GTPase activity (Roadblock/LC7/MglB family)